MSCSRKHSVGSSIAVARAKATGSLTRCSIASTYSKRDNDDKDDEMKHGVAFRKLNRTSEHRWAMLRCVCIRVDCNCADASRAPRNGVTIVALLQWR